MTKHRLSRGDLGIIALRSAADLGEKINKHLLRMRSARGQNLDSDGCEIDTYLIKTTEIRFPNGEGKVRLDETVRGRDVFILGDVSNYSITYNMYGKTVPMGPDEHFMDIKRVLSAMSGRARHVTVVLPKLYASLQHRKKARESMDCAIALQDLERWSVDEIITFDAHDPTIQNAVPQVSFLNIYPTLEILKHFLSTENWLFDPAEKLLIISPDTGAMDRAVYYAGVLGLDVGLFYKRRDHSRIVNGKNPIVQHEYLGQNVEGKNVLIVDDMINSGESVFDIAIELKRRKAKTIYVASTFAFFTEGIEKFQRYYEEGTINKVFSTNLNYLPAEVLRAEWFSLVDQSRYLAMFLDQLSNEQSASWLLDATAQIRSFLLDNGFDPDLRRMESMSNASEKRTNEN